MKRLGLAGVTLLALVMVGLAGLAVAQPGNKVAPPLLYKAKPKPISAAATKNDVLFRRFLDWRKKHPQ